jgi:hypothetical protein
MSRFTLAAVAVSAVVAAPAADKVTSLPGFGAPLTDAYSGYLTIPGGKHIHYLFYASQKAPATDPLIIWSCVADWHRSRRPPIRARAYLTPLTPHTSPFSLASYG